MNAMSEAAHREPSFVYIGCEVSTVERSGPYLCEERRDGAEDGSGDGQVSERAAA